jgi:hypothetical protein
MKSTFWMTAKQAEAETNQRDNLAAKITATNPSNYPFSDALVFCADHTKDSDVIDVIECTRCMVVRPSEVR